MGLIETDTFRLAGDATEEDFLAADRQVQTQFAYQQPGLVRRTTARRDAEGGGWIVVTVWFDAEPADAAAGRAAADRTVSAFEGLVDARSRRRERFVTLD